MPGAVVLAGHTHGAQINLPFMGRRIVRTMTGYRSAHFSGLDSVGGTGTPVYIDPGIGVNGLPLRFRAPAGAAVLRLSAGRTAQPAGEMLAEAA